MQHGFFTKKVLSLGFLTFNSVGEWQKVPLAQRCEFLERIASQMEIIANLEEDMASVDALNTVYYHVLSNILKILGSPYYNDTYDHRIIKTYDS